MLLPPLPPQGEGITSGLKKVTDDMKTKNRADRSSVVKMPDGPAAVGASATKGPAAAGGGRGGVPTGEPNLELVVRGRGWW